MASTAPVILVTGANTGLGSEIIKALCKSPKAYTILLGGRNLEKAKAAAQEVQSEFLKTPSTVTMLQVDIEDDDSIHQAFERVSTEYGRLDVLSTTQVNIHRILLEICQRLIYKQAVNSTSKLLRAR
jgi:NAD(P)-dependent dehydrogenase (short-subunit alcohol dehydrogenase family)